MKILVTGSGGLIGSEVCRHFHSLNYHVIGIDNNMRETFFGKKGSVNWNIKFLKKNLKRYKHYNVDIRNINSVKKIFKKNFPDTIVHCAAQPSHDLATNIIFKDFEVNTIGTLNLLECLRLYCPDSPFVYLSTNKVYGDNPNKLKLKELKTRWEFKNKYFKKGIDEKLSIDSTKHSFFGASKLSADLYVQEYGKYFGLKTCAIRGGCLTGPFHSGVELHGFLSYLIKANLERIPYTIYGYKGKQVRDNIHSKDVSLFISNFFDKPTKGDIYNIGGGYKNSCSIIEAIDIIEKKTSIKFNLFYNKNNRIGDHICYYTNLSKIKKNSPKWKITVSLEEIIDEIIEQYRNRL